MSRCAGTVRRDLYEPVVSVYIEAGSPMQRTAVPEATIDEDCDALLAEDDICAASQTWERRGCYAIPQASRVQ